MAEWGMKESADGENKQPLGEQPTKNIAMLGITCNVLGPKLLLAMGCEKLGN